MGADQGSYQLLERVFREEAGRLTASLVRQLGDFDLAEELVSSAVVEALEHWPHDGIPERPAQWLLTTAHRKGLDRFRREATYRAKLELIGSLPQEPPREADDRLRLIFTCCHPVLAAEAQVALTLRAVLGLTTEEIARAFMVPEETLAKRIVRAKHKIVASGVPYRIPGPDQLVERLDGVLGLYDVLTQMDSSPVVLLSRAIALRFAEGPQTGLTEVDKLAGAPKQYHLFHATRAAFLRGLGHLEEAAQADALALTLTKNTGERALLEDRLSIPAVQW